MDHSIIENLKNLYEHTESPVVCCDEAFNILWSNSHSKRFLQNENVLLSLQPALLSINFEELAEGFKKRACFFVAGSPSAFIYMKLRVTPFYDGDAFLCAVIVIEETAHDFLHSSTNIDHALGIISSRVRTPLSNVFNLLTVLSSRLEKLDLQDDTKILRDVSNNCYRILKALNTYLDYQRLFYHTYQIHPRRIELNGLLADVMHTAKTLLSTGDIEISYEPYDGEIVTDLDADSIVTAVLQVISNACIFTRPGNFVTVKLSKQKNDAVITVTDRGAGIAPENLKHVFEPYFTYEENSPSIAGLGLGLTVAKNIIELHGGSIILNSVKDEGTTIAIKLPVYKDSNAPVYLESSVISYTSGKFSPVYVYLSDVCDIFAD